MPNIPVLGLSDTQKQEIKGIYPACTNIVDSCEARLSDYVDKHSMNYIEKQTKESFLRNVRSFFCNEYPAVKFCSNMNPSIVSPPITQKPELTPEQQELLRQQQIQQQQWEQQQQQWQLQQQQIKQKILAFTTPSGFMEQNPGITIGIAVMMITGLCFFATFVCSFLFSTNKKSTQNNNRGRRGSQARRPSKGNRNQIKTGNTRSKMGKEKKKNIEESDEEKEEKTKSSYSKSKGISKVSNNSSN